MVTSCEEVNYMSVDTWVMCGNIVPEGTWICDLCAKDRVPQQTCPECSGDLRVMHSYTSEAGSSITVTKLLHCDQCHRDWDQESVYYLKTSEFRRNFWG